ncbi:MAG TPA: DUF2231 domain-containing protein [Gemmatimonadales bacterium]|jgi:uncharacterized membrane protein
MFGYDWPRLHAALNDLPAALLLVAVIFDILAAVTKRASFRTVGYWTMIVGAVGGILAVLSGLQAEEHIAHGEAVHRIMETHEKLAFVTLGIFAVVALWRILRESKMGSGERNLALVLSLAGLGALLATASFGGKLVFDHAAGIPTAVLQGEIHEREAGHHHDGEGEAGEAEHTDGEHQDGDHHDAGAAPAPSDSATAPNAGHTHAPGTPPHKD